MIFINSSQGNNHYIVWDGISTMRELSLEKNYVTVMSSKIPENHNQLNHVGLPVNANFFIIQGSNIRKSVLLINKLVYFHESYLSGCDLSPR